jgi:hypothetical protein
VNTTSREEGRQAVEAGCLLEPRRLSNQQLANAGIAGEVVVDCRTQMISGCAREQLSAACAFRDSNCPFGWMVSIFA